MIIYVLMDIIDFFNLVSTTFGSDMDFIKNIFSWIMIAVLFLNVSFTKVFIGERKWSYDILFCISFAFFSIPKLLIQYVLTSDVTTYTIFRPFLTYVKNLTPQTTLVSCFVIGLITTIILTISLYLNSTPTPKSFVGSLKLKDNFFKTPLEIIALTILSLLMGIMIYSFFMEWFAISVNSIITVIGVGYYAYKYVRFSLHAKITSFLGDVSNSGNDFMQKVVEMLANKKFIFTGLAFILSFHLLVDAGAFLAPYTLGLDTPLYFSSLDNTSIQNGTKDPNSGFGLHNPLFPFIISQSRFSDKSTFFEDYNRLAKVDIGSKIELSSIILCLDILCYFTFFCLLLLPFYVLYKNIRNKPVIFNNTVLAFFFTGIIVIILLSVGIFASLQPPLKIGLSHVKAVNGIDITTYPIIKTVSKTTPDIEIFTIFITAICSLIFLLYGRKFFVHFYYIITIGILFVLFILYIGAYGYSFVKAELDANIIPGHNSFASIEIKDQNISSLSYLNINRNVLPMLRKYQLYSIEVKEGVYLDSNKIKIPILDIQIKRNSSNTKFYFKSENSLIISPIGKKTNFTALNSQLIEISIPKSDVSVDFIILNQKPMNSTDRIEFIKHNVIIQLPTEYTPAKSNSALQIFVSSFRIVFTIMFYGFGLIGFIFYFGKNFFRKDYFEF